MRLRDRHALATLGIVAFGVAARVVAIDADPPTWHGLGFIADEGWWAHNARNRALFGTFVIAEPRDEFNQGLVIAPFFTILCWGSFAAFGPSLASLRLVSALASAATALGLASIARRAVGPESAPVAAALYLFAPFAWAFGRIGLVEETMAACLAIATALFMASGPLAWIAAGLVHAAGFATKSYAMFLGAALVVSELVAPSPRRIRKLACYAAGAAVGLALWAALIYLPFRDDYRELNLKLSQDNLPGGALQAVRNAALIPFEIPGVRARIASWLVLAPVPAVLMALALAAAALRGAREMRGDRLLAVALPLLLIYLAILAPMQYKPDRRYHALLIPEVLLATWAVRRARDADAARASQASRFLAALPIAALGATAVTGVAGVSRNAAAVLVCAITAGAALALARALPRAWPALAATARFPVAATAIVFALAVSLYARGISFTMRDEGASLAAIAGDQPVVGGVADTFLLASRARTFNSMRKGTSGRFNGDLLSRAPIDLVMTWTQPERPEPVPDLTIPGPLDKVRETAVLPDGQGGHRATVTLWRLRRAVAR